jgi:putative hydrolase of HD superfamily
MAPMPAWANALLDATPTSLYAVPPERTGTFDHASRRWEYRPVGAHRCVFLLADSGAHAARVYTRFGHAWAVDMGHDACQRPFTSGGQEPTPTPDRTLREMLAFVARVTPGASHRQDVLALASYALDAANVGRATLLQDGITTETNGHHIAMLQAVVICMAPELAPDINVAEVVQLLAVHDILEADVGDVNTLVATTTEIANKSIAEHEALERLRARFGGLATPIVRLVAAYHEGSTPEARFARLVDKAAPAITHLLNGGAALASVPDAYARKRVQVERLRQQYGGEFPQVVDWVEALTEVVIASPPGPVRSTDFGDPECTWLA